MITSTSPVMIDRVSAVHITTTFGFFGALYKEGPERDAEVEAFLSDCSDVNTTDDKKYSSEKVYRPVGKISLLTLAVCLVLKKRIDALEDEERKTSLRSDPSKYFNALSEAYKVLGQNKASQSTIETQAMTAVTALEKMIANLGQNKEEDTEAIKKDIRLLYKNLQNAAKTSYSLTLESRIEIGLVVGTIFTGVGGGVCLIPSVKNHMGEEVSKVTLSALFAVCIILAAGAISFGLMLAGGDQKVMHKREANPGSLADVADQYVPGCSISYNSADGGCYEMSAVQSESHQN